MKKLKKLILVSAAVLGLTAGNASLVKADDFINGADISILDEMENSGAVYKSNGTQKIR